MNSHEQSSNIRSILPFIALEVHTLSIIMFLIATGEPPYRDKKFDRALICDIMGGLRPSMPDSASEGYKKLAEQCCDADPDKRPDTRTIWKNLTNHGISSIIMM